jgi:hypothetical protein
LKGKLKNMKKVILSAIAVALTVLGLGGVATLSPAAYAAVLCPDGSTSTTGDLKGCTDLNQGGGVFEEDDLMKTLTVIINVVVGVVGFIAVVMIIMGGISFATSQGDTSKVAKARNTILYGVVGLVVALLAFAIVNFVLGAIFGNN